MTNDLISKALELIVENVTAGSSASHVLNQAPTKRWLPKPGDFLGKALTAAVRTILAARYEAAGNEPAPATVDEIHEAMTQGSFAFEAAAVESQKTGIRISLGKNTPVFVKLPGTDSFGLVDWYPGLRRGGSKSARASKANGSVLSAPLGDNAGSEVAVGATTPDEPSQVE